MVVVWPDIAASSKSYVSLKKDELLVSKTFFTIQGEGPYSGRPALFIRLAGCNLGGKGVTSPGCDFCDADFRLNQGIPRTFDSLYQEIEEAFSDRGLSLKHRFPFCVVTGGEPMLQDNLRGFMINSPKGYIFQIESNGTRIPNNFPKYPYLVVSPKVPTLNGRYKSGYPELSKRILERADCLKFLISADPNIPYYNLPDYAIFVTTPQVLWT